MSKKSPKHSVKDIETFSGLVVSRFGNQAAIEDEQGNIFRCHIRRSLQDLVSGDSVR